MMPTGELSIPRTAKPVYDDKHLETTPIQRQEALELLASFREGVEIMQPELWHLQALLELQADGTQEEESEEEEETEVAMYPGEYHVTPLDEQEAIERGRQARLRIIHAMSPEEREYRGRKVKPMPRIVKWGVPFVAAGILIAAWATWPEAHPAILFISATALLIACTASMVAGPQPPEPK